MLSACACVCLLTRMNCTCLGCRQSLSLWPRASEGPGMGASALLLSHGTGASSLRLSFLLCENADDNPCLPAAPRLAGVRARGGHVGGVSGRLQCVEGVCRHRLVYHALGEPYNFGVLKGGEGQCEPSPGLSVRGALRRSVWLPWLRCKAPARSYFTAAVRGWKLEVWGFPPESPYILGNGSAGWPQGHV